MGFFSFSVLNMLHFHFVGVWLLFAVEFFYLLQRF